MKGQADVGYSARIDRDCSVRGVFDRDSIQHSFLEINQLLGSTNRQILTKESK
jgi:hypothetical protein